MRRYCLIGPKGIGKTTLFESIRDRVNNVEFIIGSNVLRNLVGEDFHKFDSFPENQKEYFRKEAIKSLKRVQEETGKDLLVDGHVILYNSTTNKIEIVFTNDDIEFFTDLILYETSSAIVLERRKKDTNKKRILDINIIEMEIAEEKRNALFISKKYNISFHVIDGNDFKRAQSQLLKILTDR